VRLRLPTAVGAADERADALLDNVRGTAGADRVFYTASQLGDFSIVWHLVNLALLATGIRSRKQALRFALLLGAESLAVNQGIKRLFKRERPSFDGDHPRHVRTPSTSSFPSGHASSAVFAARVLSAEHPRLLRSGPPCQRHCGGCCGRRGAGRGRATRPVVPASTIAPSRR
jgi:undecaprenyl-diphosphatase